MVQARYTSESRCPSSKTKSAAAIEQSDMLVDRIEVLLSQETSTYATRNYIDASRGDLTNTPEPVNETCRLKMVEWLYAIIDMCQLRRSAVPIAMTYVDRILSSACDDEYVMEILKDRNKYQLVVITCLYIAVKIFEQQVISPEVLVKLSRGRYSEQDIEREESRILSVLDWKLNGPTALEFVQHFLFMISDSINDEAAMNEVIGMARLQAELSVANQSLAYEKYSVVALASIRNAMDSVGFYTPQEWAQMLQVLSSMIGVDPFSGQVQDARLSLQQMVQKRSYQTSILPRLSSELVRNASSMLPKPALEREISSPTSVSRLSVTNIEVGSTEQYA
mmetsp:Transcript_13043/g.27608  ORF Transcript_13043/g.27608 Transcript_13043/m.27608 type:complete len:336 (-) Transcript_13043:67-1074(-)